MDIVIISDFCGSFEGKDNSRFLYLIDMLKKENDVELITSNFNHGTKRHFDTTPLGDGYKITMLTEKAYPKNICIRRFFGHYVWGKNVRKYLEKRQKPDVVYCAVPPLTAAFCASKYCEKNKVKFIIDVQDLWPEAFQIAFNVPVIKDIVFFPFKILANGAYKRADEIVAVSQTYVDRALSVNRKLTSGHAVFLGTDLKQFDENVKNNPVPYKPKDEIRLGYCGTLGASYDLNIVFEAIRILKEKGTSNLKFVVMGSGPRAEEFKNNAKGLNVEFTGSLPYPKMCSVLASCDIVVNPIMRNSVGSIINKHADYAASGKPVINTQNSQEYKVLVESWNMGVNCTTAAEISTALVRLIENSETRELMGINSRKCAEVLFDRQISYKHLISIIER